MANNCRVLAAERSLIAHALAIDRIAAPVQPCSYLCLDPFLIAYLLRIPDGELFTNELRLLDLVTISRLFAPGFLGRAQLADIVTGQAVFLISNPGDEYLPVTVTRIIPEGLARVLPFPGRFEDYNRAREF